MTSLFKRTSDTTRRSRSAPSVSRVTLAAFGKHPGWDDHIPGIGIETDILAYIKQVLYVRGIGGQIDSGAWEKLEAEKRIDGFEHTFLWLKAGHIVLGQFWSSTDRQGRSKYPMVVCADGEGFPLDFFVSQSRHELIRLRESCKSTGSADLVTAACRVAQNRLNAMTEVSLRAPRETAPAIEARLRFLGRYEFGPERLGLLRVLHELDNSVNPSAAPQGSKAALADARPHHFRAPLCSESDSEGFLLWAAFLECLVPDKAPLLLISRAGVNWIDVLIGEPGSDDLFCLQASQKALPLATEIPYELSPELKPRLQQLEAKFLMIGTPTKPGEKASLSSVNPVISDPANKDEGKNASQPRDTRGGRFLTIIPLLLIAGGTIWWFGWGHGSDPAAILAPTTARNDAQKQLEPVNTATASDQKYPIDEQGQLVLAMSSDQKYQIAMAEGNAAFDTKDYARARTGAEAALVIRPKDPVATKLRDDAQGKLELATASDQGYQAAIKEGKAAFESKDYVKARTEAEAALAIRPKDPEATKLRDEAQDQLDLDDVE